MAKSSNQKLKLLYLAKILTEETDENHGLTLAEITARLAALDINADRKTLYTDFEELRHFGMDIITVKADRQYTYRLASREFELPELKLLVDCVQAAKFITVRKSNELIKKLESLVSRNEAVQLQRQVLISGRIKTMNESIYYNVDKIHSAINANVQIRFKYFNWNVKKEMELRRDGEWYHVSPRNLVWDDEYYYLVAFDSDEKMTKHFRVDKMLRLELTGLPREKAPDASKFDINAYSKSLFGMFHGETVPVTIEADDGFAGVIIDRFGKDTMMIPGNNGRFRCTVNVSVSQQFLGWIISFGKGMRILSPAPVVERMKELLGQMQELYDGSGD